MEPGSEQPVEPKKPKYEFQPQVIALMAELGIPQEDHDRIIAEVNGRWAIGDNRVEFLREYQDSLRGTFPQSPKIDAAVMLACAELERLADIAKFRNSIVDVEEYLASMQIAGYKDTLEEIRGANPIK